MTKTLVLKTNNFTRYILIVAQPFPKQTMPEILPYIASPTSLSGYMPFGYHTQGDGTNAAASEREPKNIPKTCHIDLSVIDEKRIR